MKPGNRFSSMCKHFRYLIFSLFGAVTLSACNVQFKAGHFGEDKARALARVQEFRVLHEKEDYARLYELGAPAMKASVSKEQFAAAVQTSNARYGKYKSSVLVGSSCFPNEVRLVYDAEYEKAKVREFMTWSVPHDEAELVMYQIATGQSEFNKGSQVGCPTL
jgi:hypothetical protein